MERTKDKKYNRVVPICKHKNKRKTETGVK